MGIECVDRNLNIAEAIRGEPAVGSFEVRAVCQLAEQGRRVVRLENDSLDALRLFASAMCAAGTSGRRLPAANLNTRSAAFRTSASLSSNAERSAGTTDGPLPTAEPKASTAAVRTRGSLSCNAATSICKTVGLLLAAKLNAAAAAFLTPASRSYVAASNTGATVGLPTGADLNACPPDCASASLSRIDESADLNA